MRWSHKLGACYLEVGKHKFRVWDNGPTELEPVHRLPCETQEMEPESVVEIYEEILEFLRSR